MQSGSDVIMNPFLKPQKLKSNLFPLLNSSRIQCDSGATSYFWRKKHPKSMFKISKIPQRMFRMTSALNTMHIFILFKNKKKTKKTTAILKLLFQTDLFHLFCSFYSTCTPRLIASPLSWLLFCCTFSCQ